MKARKIVNTMNTYYDFKNKISQCYKERGELICWEDDFGVKQKEKEIKKLNNDLGKFLDREI